MPDLIQREFVDRSDELVRYRAMLDGQGTPRILTVRAEVGWGKTWLLHHFRRESQDRGWPVALLDLGHETAENEITFLIEVNRQMPGAWLARVEAALQSHQSRYTVTLVKPEMAGPGAVSINAAGNINIGGDVFTGDKVIVNLPGGEDPVERSLLRHDLTQAFFTGLKTGSAPTRAALLLDSYAAAKPDTRQWLRDELFPALRSDEITSLVVVVAGSEVPKYSGREWQLTVESTQLASLPEAGVREYWQKRQLPEKYLDTVLLLSREESPLTICLYADKIEHSLQAAPA